MPGLKTWRRYVAGTPDFTGELPSPADLAEWFERSDTPGLGLVCGAISGSLEMLEVEGRFAPRLNEVLTALDKAGLGDLFEMIDAGYREVTPSGGIHWLYRCETIEGNRKLAQRPAAERPNGRDVLMETRGEGGFVVVAPTAGMFDGYPERVEWSLQRGGFGTIATITPGERSELFRLLSTFDEMPEIEHVPAPTIADRRQPGQLDDTERPGDEYNRSTTWHDVLGADGWLPIFQRGDATYWRRPDKTHGISATTNALGTDRLKVFSTSTVFDPDRTYDRFGAYATLRHNGDLQATARAIRPTAVAPQVSRTVLYGPMTPEPATDGAQPVVDVPERLIDDFLGEPEEAYDWLIEGLLERGDRLILTAPEGLGKSTLLRQIAATAAAGVHPFTGQDLARPFRSLIVDFENSRRQVRRQLGPLRDAAGKKIALYVVVQPQGMNILNETDRAWLEGIIARSRPDLVTIGPVYKMADGDPNDEQATKPVALELDRLRTVYGFAVLIEHHQPYGEGAKRPLRPVGWSGWSRWPEFGLALVGKPEDAELDVKRWRGDRDSREWPSRLAKFGSPWPFEALGSRSPTSWPAVKAAALALIDEGRLDAAPPASDIAERCGFPLAEVEQAIRNNRTDWTRFLSEHLCDPSF